jgi:glycosyltransferase involved in cell wall biosynthesis
LDLLAADLIMLMPVRVTKAKNIEFALEVVAALKEQGLNVKLVLTGPPDPHDEKIMNYFHALQKKRDELGLNAEMRFVFESGPEPAQPLRIDLKVVADLYRVADLMFMPSHQEGFGMPVLEAGLLGLPVVASRAVPAAAEIGGTDVLRFSLEDPPQQLAQHLFSWAEEDKRLRLARRTRQNFTWQAIFNGQIEPLLEGHKSR